MYVAAVVAAVEAAALTSIGRHFGDIRILSPFALGQPHVVDRVLDRVQARTCSEHPAGEDPFDFALQSDLIDFDKGIRIGRFGRRPRVANARRHLERAKLHGFVDRDIERNDPSGDLVETRKYRCRIGDALRRRLNHNFVAGLRRRICLLRNIARRAGPGGSAVGGCEGVDTYCCGR